MRSASVKKPRGKPFPPGPDERRHVHGSKNVAAVQYPIEAVNELALLIPPKEWAAIIADGVRKNRPGYKELFAKYVLGEPPQRVETEQHVTYRVIYDKGAKAPA
jgi:hypothetical protein